MPGRRRPGTGHLIRTRAFPAKKLNRKGWTELAPPAGFVLPAT
ncbi:MAG: hypothetical protein JWR33_1538 [Naasia sp.]|jgi:hypothetical protein|nr:hypothetical protein [Naasia sp.]